MENLSFKIPECLQKLAKALGSTYIQKTIDMDTAIIPNEDQSVVFCFSNRMFGMAKPIINDRKQIIESKRLKAVIQLPCGVYDRTRASSHALVFSDNCDNVCFVDATKLGAKSSDRVIVLSDEDINKITDSIITDSEIKICIPYETIKDNNYELTQQSYEYDNLVNTDGLKLKDIVNSYINRDVKSTKDVITKESGKYLYLSRADIFSGEIDMDLSYTDAEIPERVLRPNSLIFGSGVAIFENSTKDVVLEGNLVALEIDTTKASITDIKKLLCTKKFQRYMQLCRTKATLPVLDIQKLLELPIQ